LKTGYKKIGIKWNVPNFVYGRATKYEFDRIVKELSILNSIINIMDSYKSDSDKKLAAIMQKHKLTMVI
jgi:hypothetical protein